MTIEGTNTMSTFLAKLMNTGTKNSIMQTELVEIFSSDRYEIFPLSYEIFPVSYEIFPLSYEKLHPVLYILLDLFLDLF